MNVCFLVGCGRQESTRYPKKSFNYHPRQPGYIHPGSNSYSDIPCEIDDDLLALLQKEGIDDTLARHMAHLFTRDPLVTQLQMGMLQKRER